MEDDIKYLKQAIDVAWKGIKKGFGPFGAVITADGKIIAVSSNQVVLSNDPTAHAEILAIRKAASVLQSHDLGNCTLYSSCEPCPMCLGAIYWSGIKRVVYSSDRGDAAKAGFNDDHIYGEVSLEPSLRQIAFVHIDDPDTCKVFKTWEEYENKIRY